MIKTELMARTISHSIDKSSINKIIVSRSCNKWSIKLSLLCGIKARDQALPINQTIGQAYNIMHRAHSS